MRAIFLPLAIVMLLGVSFGCGRATDESPPSVEPPPPPASAGADEPHPAATVTGAVPEAVAAEPAGRFDGNESASEPEVDHDGDDGIVQLDQ
jgi:hypothetical protein